MLQRVFALQYRGKRFVFDVGPRLGGGGMAEVYLGSSPDAPEAHVAIKIPRQDLKESIRGLFLREAEAASHVSGPHVVRVVDWGEEPPFIAFEFIEGGTLAAELQNRQREQRFWSEAELVHLYRQLVEGMSAINTEVIHRDLKPDNIFFDDGVLKVGDFGIAKYVGEVTRTRTFKGVGTPLYMSPETFRGASVDWQTDQYSLGVVFYEMATLQPLFVGDWDELERLHLFQRPPRVTTVVTGLSERLATMIARMLEKRPDQRFPSWEAILSELDLLEEGSRAPEDAPSESALVQKAAEQVEAVRSEALQRERIAEERRTKTQARQELLEYWAEEFFGQVQSRVDGLNQSLGEEAIRFSRSGGPEGRCYVSFISAQLEIMLGTVSIEASEDVMLWGWIQVQTSRTALCGNLLLTAEPPPYGTWYDVTMRVFASMDAGFKPYDDVGGRYTVIGGNRLVVALNPEALLQQRRKRNVISGVNYEEETLNFGMLLDKAMQLLVEDAR